MTMNALLFTQDELTLLRQEVGQPTLMGKTIDKHCRELEAFMRLPLEVPGHGEAGGYEHNRHKQNYTYMNLAGRLFLVTQDQRYAAFVRDLLDGYADIYLTLDYQVQKNTNPAGRLFHQILNEHGWLLFASIGYSCVSHTMSEAQRTRIIDRLFVPMIEMSTEKYAHRFDHIHNHGVWAVAAVGACAVAIDKPEYLEMAVYGRDRSATSGFLDQVSHLFSPSGYYLEGPYYSRFTIRPLVLFAEIIHRHLPEVDIYRYKDGVVGKTVQALLATAYPNGVFPALNDASQSMSINDAGVQVAVSIYGAHYALDDNILGMAKIQQGVWMHPCGLALSNAFEEAQAQREIGLPYWPSVELCEGPNGDQGAQGFIRMQDPSGDVTQLVMNYGMHGMGHGHFDTLGITLFNRGQEVLREYGFARWVNVEPKFGGRYLAENPSYARQTVAHNLVTVDQQCQNQFDVERADARSGTPHFFDATQETLKGMSAFANEHVDGCDMQRSVFLLSLDELEAPLLIDLYRIDSQPDQANTLRSYDYTHQYQGQIIRSNVEYHTHQELHPLGDSHGYQHLWNVAEGEVADCALVSWLQGSSYYTWVGASSNSSNKLIFTRTGANDPSFNLRSEPAFLLRSEGPSTVFASALETHGYFNEEFEQSVNARGQVESIQVVGNSDVGSVVQIRTRLHEITLMVSHQQHVAESTPHQVAATENANIYSWNGAYALDITPKN
ncbi:heparinase II/III family protein [Vibrio cholerae]